jgi:hypothetical protein
LLPDFHRAITVECDPKPHGKFFAATHSEIRDAYRGLAVKGELRKATALDEVDW